MAKKHKGLMGPDPTKPQQAGNVERLPAGKIIFLAPHPLPTGEPALNEGAISDLNNSWLDYGAGWPGVFGNQLIIAWCFWSFLIVAFVFPVVVYPFVSERVFRSFVDESFRNGVVAILIGLVVGGWAAIEVYTNVRR